MTQAQKDILLDALAMKEASIKRAMNTKAQSPRFKSVYEAELLDLDATRKECMTLKVTQ